ncbi:HIT family protein [Pediococcus argentinicus]|uniref:Diadenosine tetraphosphate (Ap4A) hydrolase n=1 Tax=Pediococcus argentinicus TaxID=480391 RepID=A0A0R2NNT5_9LACO|nr:HIT family protein [Pediococcus argentinicus]KRO25677.1 diadenosine tetraphosphate (Ap4A) hydrolase [Pediococcus argentinicus]NKZ21986.1 HIT family protein [Pediococcus argentinicus]GEP19155.1 histidine triad protein [Pediococcus argentinicus]
MDNNCIFCKIIAGDIPSYTVYEDDKVKAFLDISQTTPGHTLVIPKVHIPDIYAYDEELAEQVFARIPKIARAIKNSNPSIKGMNIVNNNGELAYQSVFHSHFHLIPRYSEDDTFSINYTDNGESTSSSQLEELQTSIQNAMEDK